MVKVLFLFFFLFFFFFVFFLCVCVFVFRGGGGGGCCFSFCVWGEGFFYYSFLHKSTEFELHVGIPFQICRIFFLNWHSRWLPQPYNPYIMRV